MTEPDPHLKEAPAEATAKAIAQTLLAWADDELILAHRNSEWTGHAPILEEDIAFSNIAQDELGHANIWYGLYQDLTGAEPDKLVFFRDVDAYRCVQLVELPKGDWAFSMVRQYLFDAVEQVRLNALLASEYQPLADAAAKMRPEEMYHYRHTTTWLQRLGLGTAESNRRCQEALDQLWPYALQLFARQPWEEQLIVAGFLPDTASLQADWETIVRAFLATVDLQVPNVNRPPGQSREQHSRYLPELLADLQEVARLDPDARW